MRVFKAALGVLALTLGVGLAGSVSGNASGQGHRRDRRFSAFRRCRRGKRLDCGYTERKGTIDFLLRPMKRLPSFHRYSGNLTQARKQG
jgi:hypothetical protein